MKLEEQERQENEEVMNLIDQTQEQGKILKINDNSKEESYIGYATYMYDTEDEGGVYLLFVPENFPRSQRFSSKEWLHDMILNQDEVNLIDIEDAEEEYIKILKRNESYENPRDDIHIVVKTTDDGRYKDDFMYVRESKDDRKQKYLGGLNEEDSRFEYINLGSFREVVESDESYGFELKPFAGGVPMDFTAITSKEEREEMKEKLQG